MAFKELSDNLNIAGEKVQEYIENTAEYHKLRLFKSTMKFTTSLVNMLILGSILLLLLAFLSVGFAMYLSRIIGYPSAGFFIVAGIYLITLILMAVFGKQVVTKKLLSKFSELVIDKEDIAAKDVAEKNMKEFEQ